MSYYKSFENRTPYQASKFSLFIEALFQITAVVFIFVGFEYLIWRWNHSINWDAIWISLPLYFAEILAFIGSLLTIFNYWSHKDAPKTKPIHFLSEMEELNGRADRPIKIDLFIATYNEELEIVEDTVKDAIKVKYNYNDVIIKVYLLDDGHRDGTNPKQENFKLMAEKYQVTYISRENNIGYPELFIGFRYEKSKYQ